VDDAHPAAKGNLEIEFKKILTARNKGNLNSNRTDQEGVDLVDLFTRLHAHCYKGIDFVEHEELENETLCQLALDLKERSVTESTLRKFVMINVAAQHFAGVRVQGKCNL
jgi:Est1 DNA/RNA binding domain